MNNVRRNGIPIERIASLYLKLKRCLIEEGYASEIDWQDEIIFDNITESDFLREAAWVILSSGMRETVIRRKFPEISSAFFEWHSSRRIISHSEECRANAILYFNNPKKIEAILKIALLVFNEGYQSIRKSIQKKGIPYIMQLPYMGPATSYHFAKNIGLRVAKPDRHLTRIAKEVGYTSPQGLCSDIGKVIGEKISVVDLVLWRYATLHSNYLDVFSSCSVME